MSHQIKVNPSKTDDMFLRSLNECYPNYGGYEVFDWTYHRRIGSDPMADRLAIYSGADMVAGSGITYRSLTLPNERSIRVGIMTNSWTLPSARKTGCFSGIIEKSVEVAAEQDCALLLAFVAEANGSFRQLERAGAGLVQSSYLRYEGETASDPCVDSDGERIGALMDTISFDRFVENWSRRRFGKCRFTYPDTKSWRKQFIERPWSVEVAHDSKGRTAWLERHEDTDRINAIDSLAEGEAVELISRLIERATKLRRKLFMYSNDPTDTKRLTDMGFIRIPGYITMIITNTSRIAVAKGLEQFPAQPSNRDLSDPSSPWYLGEWSLQSGDRM